MIALNNLYLGIYSPSIAGSTQLSEFLKLCLSQRRLPLMGTDTPKGVPSSPSNEPPSTIAEKLRDIF